jgi:hypothetical protein
MDGRSGKPEIVGGVKDMSLGEWNLARIPAEGRLVSGLSTAVPRVLSPNVAEACRAVQEGDRR